MHTVMRGCSVVKQISVFWGFPKVAILIFRSTFQSWYSMLFFRFSTTKRQSGLSTHQASQDQALQRWCWRLARRRWTVSVCPVSTQHTESHGPECLLVVLLGASGAGLQPARTGPGPAGHVGGFWGPEQLACSCLCCCGAGLPWDPCAPTMVI